MLQCVIRHRDASGAGPAANPLDQPAPQTHKTRAATPQILSGLCGFACDTRRRRKPAYSRTLYALSAATETASGLRELGLHGRGIAAPTNC
jgi:hypothetical protein